MNCLYSLQLHVNQYNSTTPRQKAPRYATFTSMQLSSNTSTHLRMTAAANRTTLCIPRYPTVPSGSTKGYVCDAAVAGRAKLCMTMLCCVRP